MTREELLGRRWAAQRLGPEAPLSPEETVALMGAVQAQDLVAAQTAIALRAGTSSSVVAAALDSGRLVRTHLLRPTWHIVKAVDLRWIVGLTGPRISQGGAARFREVGLPPEVRSLSRKVIENALFGGPLTRDEIKSALVAGGIPTQGQALVHALMDAELELLVCNGPRQGKESTYDLVDRRIPPSSPVPVDEATTRLALRYIRGHGPATDRDFSWWSGLPAGAARRGFEACGTELASGDWEGNRVWFDPRLEPVAPEAFCWLPAYDEYIIAFADRSAVLSPERNPKAISSNGIFWPVVLTCGQVCGTWNAAVKKNLWSVKVEWFSTPPPGGEESRRDWEARLGQIRG